MIEPLAHSARPEFGISAQPYSEHVRNVTMRASENARDVARYYRDDSTQLIGAIRLAAEFHDLGKLDRVNQEALQSMPRKKLPLNHVDAGVAHIFDLGVGNLLAATLVYSHHVGLPDFQEQRDNRTGDVLRNTPATSGGISTKDITDKKLAEYLSLHTASIQGRRPQEAGSMAAKLKPLLVRIALSCLVDADHYDTARNYRQLVDCRAPQLRAIERLQFLDSYVECLAELGSNESTALRTQVYEACKNADTLPGMYACDSPVGTGKTTAIMSHLLRVAQARGLRRIFVVLPFTNIIDQSVDVYRTALVGVGENPENVIAAHHHRADFEDENTRQLAFLWEAPIVVTTAVQFFETLASNRPAALRKLHQVPGSAVFIDEAHAALPVHLWPQAWQWLRELESEWGCHFVLGSGSLGRFWELEEFSDPPSTVPELVKTETRALASEYETTRVRYKTHPDLLDVEELISSLKALEGPRLLIVNTVQSAAVLASAIADNSGRESVEHISTSLCPRDRRLTLGQVKARLQDRTDSDWTLVGTSCIEAGVDLSFRNGMRERCSLSSLIQVGGRVNRANEDADAEVWDFRLRHDGLLRGHPTFDTSARVLGELFQRGLVGSQHCTEAMRNEIRSSGIKAISNEIVKAERNLQFPTVAEKFNVIDSHTVTVIVEPDLVERLLKREKVAPRIMQELSVQIWGYRKSEFGLKAIDGFPELYHWPLLYDRFLGYMAGVIQLERIKRYGGTIV
jgi:CRISPR-associated endonuclease/helicase Cas3